MCVCVTVGLVEGELVFCLQTAGPRDDFVKKSKTVRAIVEFVERRVDVQKTSVCVCVCVCVFGPMCYLCMFLMGGDVVICTVVFISCRQAI